MAARLAGSWIGYQARVRPDHVALADLATGRRLRYGEFDDRIGRLAGVLARGYGVARGDRVAMLSRNCAQAFELMYACGRIGAIFVPLNVRLSDSELDALIADAAPGLLAGEAGLLGRDLAAGLPRLGWNGQLGEGEYEPAIAAGEPAALRGPAGRLPGHRAARPARLGGPGSGSPAGGRAPSGRRMAPLQLRGGGGRGGGHRPGAARAGAGPGPPAAGAVRQQRGSPAHDAGRADRRRPGRPGRPGQRGVLTAEPGSREDPGHRRADPPGRRIGRLLVLARPADLDAGEITDKGYVNQRRVLTRRAALVGLLYAKPSVPGVIVAEGTP